MGQWWLYFSIPLICVITVSITLSLISEGDREMKKFEFLQKCLDDNPEETAVLLQYQYSVAGVSIVKKCEFLETKEL